MIEIYAEPSVTHSVKRAFGWSALTLAGEFGYPVMDDKRTFRERIDLSWLPEAVALRFPPTENSSAFASFTASAKEVLSVANLYSVTFGMTVPTLDEESGLFGETDWTARYTSRQFMQPNADTTIHCSVQVDGLYVPPRRTSKRQQIPTPPAQPPLEAGELRSVMWHTYATLDRLRLS